MGLLQNLTGWHAIIILVVVLLLFGATKLPALAKSVGQSMTIFRTEINDAKTPADDTAATAAHTPAAPAPEPVPATPPR